MRVNKLSRKTKKFLKNDKIIPFILTALVVALILSSGPATAFRISIFSPSTTKANRIIEFPIRIEINTNEVIPIKKITLNVTGPAEGIGASVDCTVYLNGTSYCFDKIAGKATSDINVSLSVPQTYGYGYLYGYWTPPAYGYGYIVSPEPGNYTWDYGYGYAGLATIILNVTWKVPITPTIYNIRAGVYADGQFFEVEKEIQVLPPDTLPGEKGGARITQNITVGENSIDVGNSTDLSLTLRAKNNVTAEINVSTSYENIVKVKPSNLNGVKFFVINVDPNTNAGLDYAIINVSYTDSEISSLDEKSLRIYKWNGTQWISLPCPSFGCVDTTNNFVYANVTSFSLFGVFGSKAYVAPSAAIIFTPSIKLIAPNNITQQVGTTRSYSVTVYNDGKVKLDKVYLTITGLPRSWYSLPTNISLEAGETKALQFTLTIPKTNPKTLNFNLTAYGETRTERVSDTKMIVLTLTSAPAPKPPTPVCGNGVCEPGEDYTTCPQDCPRPTPPKPPTPVCGNGVCEPGEDYTTCPQDCPRPTPISPIMIIAIIVVMAIIVFILIRKFL